MRQKFKLRNQQQQHLATILYFFEEQLNGNVGMIFTNDLSRNGTWLYQNETIDEVVTDLANRLNIEYYDYVEL
jgi:hypothetical protein